MYCTRISNSYCGLYSTALHYGIEMAMMAFELKPILLSIQQITKMGKRIEIGMYTLYRCTV